MYNEEYLCQNIFQILHWVINVCKDNRLNKKTWCTKYNLQGASWPSFVEIVILFSLFHYPFLF